MSELHKDIVRRRYVEYLDECKGDTYSGQSMRILMVSESIPPQINGIARRVAHYRESLEKLGHDVTLVAPGSRHCWDYPNIWNEGNKFMILKPSFLMDALMRGQEFDVVHCVMPLNVMSFLLLAALKLNRIMNENQGPHLIVSWHCNLADYSRKYLPHWLGNTMVYQCAGPLRVLADLADRLLVPTFSTEPDVSCAFGRDRIGICKTGIEVNKFNPDLKNSQHGLLWQQRRREDLKRFGDKKHLLLYVGRLAPEKGMSSIMHAMQELQNDCVLWIVGDGPIRTALEQEARELKLPVVFWGFQRGEALHSVYTVADCFVSGSTTETFGQTINEALASGILAAIPRSPGFKDAYAHLIDPEKFMWKPDDQDDMNRTIRRTLNEGKVVDRARLENWDQAASHLADEYSTSKFRDHSVNGLLHVFTWVWFLVLLTTIATQLNALVRQVLKFVGFSEKYAVLGATLASVAGSTCVIWSVVTYLFHCVLQFL